MPAEQMTTAQRRAALRGGDPAALPRRDQGATRKLARDYVDSHRMASNFLLLLFPVLLVSWLLPVLQIVVIVVFVGLLAEWCVRRPQGPRSWRSSGTARPRAAR